MLRLPRRLLPAALLVAAGLAPVLAVTPARAETVVQVLTVSALSPDGATSVPLEAYATYRLTASGTYDYDAVSNWGKNLGDAECSTHASEPIAQPGWARYRYPVYGAEFLGSEPLFAVDSDLWDPDPSDDPVDLYVDRRPYEWVPTVPGPGGCNTENHTYTAIFSPVETRPVTFAVLDAMYRDNSGSLTIEITKVADPLPVPPSGEHIETVLVNSHTSRAFTSTTSLENGTRYLLVAHGSYNYYSAGPRSVGIASYFADAECSRTEADPVYTRHRYSNSPAAGDDALDIYVDAKPVDWAPMAPIPNDACARAGGFYGLSYTGKGTPVSLGIVDGGYDDNTGTLSVEIYELPPLPVVGPLPPAPVPPGLPPVSLCNEVDYTVGPVKVNERACVPPQ